MDTPQVAEDVLCEDGVIEVARRDGDTKIQLTLRSGFSDTPAHSVSLWLTRKQQQALREAVRVVQSRGLHRWP
jgi:hypothetical protein